MNPMEMIRNVKNPKDLVMRMISNNSNPMMGQLIRMAHNGNSKGIENFARNFLQEQGRNFDEEFGSFISNLRR